MKRLYKNIQLANWTGDSIDIKVNYSRTKPAWFTMYDYRWNLQLTVIDTPRFRDIVDYAVTLYNDEIGDETIYIEAHIGDTLDKVYAMAINASVQWIANHV